MTLNQELNKILIIDFGSQFTQLIARRVRELDVYSEILPWDINEEKIIKLNGTHLGRMLQSIYAKINADYDTPWNKLTKKQQKIIQIFSW